METYLWLGQPCESQIRWSFAEALVEAQQTVAPCRLSLQTFMQVGRCVGSGAEIWMFCWEWLKR